MIVQPGDVLLATHELATFFLEKDEDYWIPIHLGEGGVWLVLESWHDERDETNCQYARMLSLVSDDPQREWVLEGTFDTWSTLEKLI